MSLANYLQSLSVESASLLLGAALLFAILITLQVRNTRWVRRLAKMEESKEARDRVEKLLSAVEHISKSQGKGRGNVNRPIAKSSVKRIPATRTPKINYKRAR